MLVLSQRIVLDCFYILIFYSEKFSTDVCRLPYAVNVNHNLSCVKIKDIRQKHPMTVSSNEEVFRLFRILLDV